MKKFTNNAIWGLVSVALNLVILCLVVVSAVQLTTYDNKNTYLQDSIRPQYKYWSDSLSYAEKSLSSKRNSLEGYRRLYAEKKTSSESLRNQLEVTPDADSLMVQYRTDTTQMGEYIQNILRLQDDSCHYSDTVKYAKNGLAPWKSKYDDAVKDVSPSLGSFNIIIVVTAILLAIKFLCLGFWMMRNGRNIRKIFPWSKKFSDDLMNIFAWFIPIYNLFKPCSLFSNLFSDTRDALREKSIITQSKDSNHMESISLWWGSMIFAKIIMPLFIGGITVGLNIWILLCSCFAGIDVASNSLGSLGFGTYFGTAGNFFYLRPHSLVLTLFIIGWVVYLLYECYLIFSYNKLNKMLCNNEDKFDVEEATKVK
jgi:hypothetical protein